MKKSLDSWLGRSVGELSIIVVGVLLALAADAAWEARGERQLEAALLQDLVDEFRLNAEELQADLDANTRTLQAMELYFTALEEGALPEDSLEALLVRSGGQFRFDPEAGTLSSLIASGQLRLISDRALRGDLAAWLNRVDEARRTFETQRDFAIALVVAESNGDNAPPHFMPAIRTLRLSGRGTIVRDQSRLLEDTEALVARLEQLVAAGR